MSYGRIFAYLARHALADNEIVNHIAMSRATKHVSKHVNQRNLKTGKCFIASNSSFRKRLRAERQGKDGLVQIKALTPARRRAHWHASLRQKWNDISTLADNLAKDRERRRMMRLAA